MNTNYDEEKAFRIFSLLKDKYNKHSMSGEIKWMPKQTRYYDPINYEEFLWHCWDTHLKLKLRLRQGYEKVK